MLPGPVADRPARGPRAAEPDRVCAVHRMTIVPRPLEEVWSFAPDFENRPLWRSPVATTRRIVPATGAAVAAVAPAGAATEVGAAYRETIRAAGWRCTYDFVVTALEPGRAAAFRITSGPAWLRGGGDTLLCAHVDRGTLVTLVSELPAPESGAGAGGFAAPLTLLSGWLALVSLSSLKRHLERDARPR